jgi:hypothetical protein
MRNVSNEICIQNGNAHFTRRKFSLENHTLWKNLKKYGTAGQATDGDEIWGIRFANQKNEATDTYSEYVLVIAFPRK